MRALDCDFCGGTAGGAYEVLPADLDPTPDEQVRLILCDSCLETLDDVVAPLLDRLRAGASGSADDSFAADTTDRAPSTAATEDADDGIDNARGNSGLTIDTAGHDSPSPAGSDPPAAADDHGTTDSARTAAENDAASAAADTADSANDRGGAAATEENASDGTATDADEEPADFRKVMRFLNNREFPIDRAEVTEFAAGAYDLDDEAVREIFDYAIERGILVEENGRLSKR